ncbi:MAG: TIGR04282 family arsenosugar biosynthesis glycosyltransferase [Paracoccaceae bacterium]
MLKEPRAGEVKTRLGRDIGMTSAAWWFRHHSAGLIRRLNHDPRWQLRLSVAPLRALYSPIWPADIARDAQIPGNLGQRMHHIFATSPPGPVVLIGSDIIGITPRLIETAFRTLGRKDCVFGPATDGGFWLAGMRRGPRPLPANLFQNVRWSSQHSLSDTRASLGGASCGLIQTLSDVDTVNDLA